ncbi:predicted protein [Uncinocarpus reesii 1704]|uniref:Uncharacterized protein n=1 Tax=Uncinocarpus reesii (strain UAMH 1704) TaxID=336963 RepID=C4JSC4_UNCRE|nr:uncharacterized protein UREG_05363 [Uncinocarpus reesii 1704]EEP80521.1 predicted protein [Uncinocarpus reesii 1704]
MRLTSEKWLSMKCLATYFLLCNGLEVAAKPATEATKGPGPVTVVASRKGGAITVVFTPTSVSVAGITPPVTKATTITTTKNSKETAAIAIAAGAGIVANGALAAWVFRPIPEGPPAPTTPPPYSTSQQPKPSKTKDPPKGTTTTMKPAACPFTKVNAKHDFTSVPDPPKWTGKIPSQTVTSKSPECTKAGKNNELLRGTNPDYVNELAKVFCKGGLSKDRSSTLGYDDLPKKGTFTDKLKEIQVKFNFKFGRKNDACPKNCAASYASMIKRCQYNSHAVFGGGSLEQGCGTYRFMIEGEPRTELSCKKSESRGVFFNYQYSDAALDSIENFCKAQDGKVIKQKDEKTWIKETSFSVTYSDKCKGSGEYKIKKDYCRKYLQRTVNDCDTHTRVYKHGGTVTDTDNCGSFTFHPTGYDVFFCYPHNKDGGLITQGTHAIVSLDIVKDAINAFCNREGDGQTYTISPDIKPNKGFIQDTCKEKGYASCGYFYTKDGKRVTKKGEVGDLVLRMEASYHEQKEIKCGPKKKCKDMLNKVIGIDPKGMCVGKDPKKLDLGSFLESSEKGCVLWNMWAVETH